MKRPAVKKPAANKVLKKPASRTDWDGISGIGGPKNWRSSQLGWWSGSRDSCLFSDWSFSIFSIDQPWSIRTSWRITLAKIISYWLTINHYSCVPPSKIHYTAELLYSVWSPPWHVKTYLDICFIYSDDLSDMYSNVLFIWHSIWYIFWHSIWHSIWQSVWHVFWQSFWHSIWHIFWHFICHSIWHTFRHSIWHSIWQSTWYIFWHSI